MTAAPQRAEPAAGDAVADTAGDTVGDTVDTVLSRWLPTPLLRASLLLHAAALAGVAAAPRRWRWAAAAVVADQLLLLAASVSPRSSLLGPNLTRLPPASPDAGRRPRQVALSFDDGPDPEVTPRILDLLAAAGARASFFLIGRHAAAHPELVRRIVAAGHRVENHTWSHPATFAFGGPWAMGRQIDRAQALLTDLAGRPPAWFRAPAGMRSPILAGVLAQRGLGLASWTRRGLDAVDPHPGRVARRLIAGLAAGDVLLLHDGSPAGRPRPGVRRGGWRAERRSVAVAALPAVLEALAQRGLTGVPLPDQTVPDAAHEARR